MATVNTRLALALLLTTGGCGDALIDREYRGIPIWQIVGSIGTTDSGTAQTAPHRLAMFYSPDALTQKTESQDEVKGVLSQLIEDTGTTITLQPGIGYVLNLYEPPAPALRARSTSGGDAGFAVGRIMAYTDENRDGRRQPEEPFIGTEPTSAYVHVPSPLSADQSPTQRPLAAGFFQLNLPQLCTFTVQTPTDPGTCGVDIGRECATDDICNGGICLKETSYPWPGGYCTVTISMDPRSTACRPALASPTRLPVFGARPLNTLGYYLKACVTDQDCEDDDGGRRGLYVCDAGLLACRPSSTTQVRIQGPDEVIFFESFCPSNPTMRL